MLVEWLAWLTYRKGSVAKLNDVGSNLLHEGGQC
jgi:hypothetical protein